ncbi:MAG: FHA domain-containing protein [Deltaproteobacteria bacterium]|nr:FHA domain-containing protein [Deltaproteobacteria bacterium]
MELELGIVCGECDLWAPRGTSHCPSCSNPLGLFDDVTTQPIVVGGGEPTGSDVDDSVVGPAFDGVAWVSESDAPAIAAIEERFTAGPPERAREDDKSETQTAVAAAEEPMEQARSYICKSCHSQVPPGHKFCGRCGTPMPVEVASAKTSFFGAMQAPGKAKLVLIRGEGLDGISYHLNSVEHVAGRSQGAILFPDDATLSPKHANFFYRDSKLYVRDEGSLNGVYGRVRGTTSIEPSDVFMAGQQYFRLELTPKPADAPEPDGTYFYSSPKRPSAFRIVHLLRGGATGMVYCARETSVQIGREGSEMNFPADPYMSSKHVKLEVGAGGKFTLTDLGSKNGTFLRIHRERELAHGDYVFLGRQLLRVEITP